MIDPTLSADDQQTQTIQGSLFLAKDTTPDVASEAVRLGKTLNLPAEFVMRNMDWARSVTPSKQVADLPLTHPKTAQFLSDPINASVTKDEIERLKVIEDVMREGAAEPGLFSKESRSAVIGALRSQGYKIEEVEQPKGVFSKTLERTAKVLSPQVTELTAPVQFGGVGLPSGVRQTIEQAPVSAPLQAEAPAQQPPVELATQPAGFLETLNRNVARGQFIPFVGGGIEVAEMKDLYDTVRRIGDGSATAKDWIDVLKVDEEIRRGTTFGGKVGTGLAMMPGFIGEMAATSGMATAGRKAAVNAGLATVRKVLNKSTRQVAENLALKSAVELGGWATKSVLVGAAGMPHRVAANALRRRIPALANISEDDAGQLEAFLKEPDESLARSIFKGIAESSIEVGSEFSGGLLGRIGSKLAPAQLDAVKAMVVGRWFKLHPTSGWSQFQQRLKQVQFHGIMAEAGEEVVGDVLTLLSQPVTGLETPDFDIENYLSAAVSAAFIPGAALLRYGPGMIRASNQLAQRAQAQVDFFRDLAEGSVNQKTRERVPGMLATLGDMAAQNGPVETAFASLEKWNAYFESQGIDPRAFAEKVLGSTEAYDRASSTGADLEIPIGAYAEFIAPTEHNEGLMRDMRLGNAAAPTVNEMQAELQSQEAMLDNMVKLSQSSEALQKQAQTLDERIAALTQEATGAETKLAEIQTRLEQIRARFPQTPAEQLVASLTGQTDSPEMQALATEYDTLTRDAGAIEKQRTDLESLRSERTKVQADIEQVLSEEERFRAAFPSKNPEVEAYAAEVAQNLTATGRYKNERMARVHGNIAARMLYILGLRSGNSLQAMVEKYPIQITAGETDISQALVQAGTLAQGELSARDAEYMAAVEAGDMEKAQQMVDEAAKAAGYDLSHRRKGGSIADSQNVVLFKKRRDSQYNQWGNEAYGEKNYLLQSSALTDIPEWVKEWALDHPVWGRHFSEASINPKDIIDSAGSWDDQEFVSHFWSENENRLLSEGVYGFETPDGAVVFDPAAAPVKSADPVTRDADGNVIPLSERFNPEEKSILFQDSSAELGTLAQGELSARDAEYMAAVEAGDMETAQRMVDEAAKAAGYGRKLFHGTNATKTVEGNSSSGSAEAIQNLKTLAKRVGLSEWYGVTSVYKRLANNGQMGVTQKDAANAEKWQVEATGTYKPSREKLSFNVFSLPSGELELGVHLGNESAASMFGDVFPFFANLGKPFRLPDLGTWNYKSVMREMRKRGVKISEAEYNAVFNASDNNAVLRELLQSKGIESIVYRNEAEGEGDSFIAFEPSQIKSADPVTRDADGNVIPLSERFNPEEKSILFQDSSAELLPRVALKQEQKQIAARGFIQFDPTQRGAGRRPFTIGMLKKANASTFMHEMAHWYLEVSLDIDNTEAAQGDLKADVDAIRKWLGITDAYPTEAQHEVFARGFEKYLMEGVAPSESVRGFFASMRAWMIRIYKDLWHPDLNATLSDDIRRVFDRMLATEEEIDAAQAENSVEPMFMEKPAFMSDDQWERYSKFVSRASMLAREKLQARLMKEVADAEKQERKDEAQRIREEVAAELNLNREQVALAFLRFGKQPNGSELAGSFEPFKLDRDSVKESGVSREIRKRLKNLGVYRVEGGQDVDQAANVLGFESGVELLNALAATESFNKAVDAETQKRVDALHPSLMADQAELSDAANEAVRNEQRDEVIAAEMAALARKVREDQQAVGRVAAGAFPPLGMLAKKLLRANESQALAVTQLQDLPLINQLARRAALRNLALLEIRAIRPSVYLAAAKRASAAATNAAASGNYLKALGEKEAELVGHAMYRAARQIQNETEKMQRYLLRMSEDKALARLGKAGASYRDQVQAILERFQLRSTPLVRITERENLKKWIEAQESEGHTVSISDALYDEAFQKDFRTMTFQEFKDVYEAVKQIDKLASLKNKLLKAERDRQFDVFKTEALASMQAGRTAKPVQPQAKSKRERIIGTINGLFQSLRRLTDIVEELDQFKPLGVMFDGIQRPVNDAQNKKDVMVSEATQKLRALYESFTTEERAEMKKRRVVQGVTQNFSLSHEDRICIALNWGNADNRIKLVDGYNGFTEADIEAILDTLTEKDVKFVQAVWDYIDEFWPAIKAKQERVYGIAPEKVEATPWVTKFGVMRGGYYPLKYTGPKAESESAADMAKQMMRGAAGFASTARGHTQARVEGVDLPVKIGFEVLHNHVAQVIHDLTHHEMLIDVNRILGDKEIAGTIAGYYSQELLTELKDVVMDIASGGLEKRSPWESVATWLRTRSTVAGMAWNLWTVIQQTYGFTNAIPKVGAKYIARSLNAWVSNAEGLEEFVANIHEKSIFMRNRAKTMDRDISELRNVVEPSNRTALTDSYFYMIGKGQMLADIPTWHAGWLHSKEQLKASDVDAIAFADKLVEDTQGGGAIKAQAKVQRMGGAFFKLWTTFYSYSNALLNQNVQLVKRTEFRDPLSVGRLLVDMSILNTLPLLISMLLRDLLRGDEDKEDPWYAKLAKEQVMSVFGMFPFGREIPGLLEGRKYEGPAGTRLLPEIQKLGVTVKKEVEERGLNPAEWDYDRPLVTSVLRTGGMLFNIPAPALQKAFEGANALWEGTTTNPGVLIVGPTKEERK